jgi:NADH dehydrogenase FAD-containing subunit
MLVEGQTKVFAFGDITSPGLMESPFNSGYVIQQESKKLAKNVLLAIAGKPLKPMGKPPLVRGAMLSLGKGHGAGHFDNMVLPQCMVAKLKSKDVFRKKTIAAFSK